MIHAPSLYGNVRDSPYSTERSRNLYIYCKHVNFTLLSQRKYAAFIRKGENGIAEFLSDREKCTMNPHGSQDVFRGNQGSVLNPERVPARPLRMD
jgi:hypothetical protein